MTNVKIAKNREIFFLRLYRIFSLVCAFTIFILPILKHTIRYSALKIVKFHTIDFWDPMIISFFMGILIYLGSNILLRIIMILLEDRPLPLLAFSGGILLFGIWVLHFYDIGRIFLGITIAIIIFIVIYQVMHDSS